MKRILPCLLLSLLGLTLALPALAGPVDINHAPASTLAAELNGVGQARAEAIVEYRENNGPFRSVDDLQRVSGIGPATLRENRDRMTVEPVGK